MSFTQPFPSVCDETHAKLNFEDHHQLKDQANFMKRRLRTIISKRKRCDEDKEFIAKLLSKTLEIAHIVDIPDNSRIDGSD